MSKNANELLTDWIQLTTEIYGDLSIGLVGLHGKNYRDLKQQTQEFLDKALVDILYTGTDDEALATSFFSHYYQISYTSALEHARDSERTTIISNLERSEALKFGKILYENRIFHIITPNYNS
jgi:hypothetical protein